jgi:hypothetical protein
MSKLNQWYNRNGADVYEGKYAMAVSINDKGNKIYSVFISKEGIKIDANGEIIYTPFESEHIGAWNDSKLASKAVKNIDKVLSTKGIHKMVVNLPTDNTSFIASGKKGSLLMVIDAAHPEDEYHEMGHILSNTVMVGKSIEDKLEAEQKAIKEEIKLRKRDGVYTSKSRKDLLNNASITVPSLGNKQKALSILAGLERGDAVIPIELGKEHIRYIERSDKNNPYKSIIPRAGRMK